MVICDDDGGGFVSVGLAPGAVAASAAAEGGEGRTTVDEEEDMVGWLFVIFLYVGFLVCV